MMDTFYETYHEYYNLFLLRTLTAHAEDPYSHLTAPHLQLCFANALEERPWSPCRYTARACYEIPWFWLPAVLLVPWLLIFVIGCLYKLFSRVTKSPRPRKSSIIKVRVPGADGPVTPQSPTVRRDSGPEINPFLQPVKIRKTVHASQPRSPGYLQGYVPGLR